MNNDTYRPCVGIMLINDKNQVLVAKRIDSPGSWQMPQGGIDPHESSAEEAMKRELYEEIGLKNEHIKILAIASEPIYYDVPKEKIPVSWNGKFQGQKILFFLVKLIGRDNDINLNGENPEFTDWKWSNLEDVAKEAIDFKKNIYQKVVNEFKEKITI